MLESECLTKLISSYFRKMLWLDYIIPFGFSLLCQFWAFILLLHVSVQYPKCPNGLYRLIFTLPVFSATINIRKILTFNFRLKRHETV